MGEETVNSENIISDVYLKHRISANSCSPPKPTERRRREPKKKKGKKEGEEERGEKRRRIVDISS